MKSDRFGMSRNPVSSVSRGRFFRGRCVIRDVPSTALAIASFFFIFLMGCGEKTGNGDAAIGGEAPRRLGTTDSLMDEGDEVFLDARTASMIEATGSTTAAASGTDGRGRWSLMLVTVSGDNHPMQARAIRGEIIRTFPELNSIFVAVDFQGIDDLVRPVQVRRRACCETDS